MSARRFVATMGWWPAVVLAVAVTGCAGRGARTSAALPVGHAGPRCDEADESGRGWHPTGWLFTNDAVLHGEAPAPCQYLFNVGLSVSQLGNTLIGGDPDETICSRLGRGQRDGRFVARCFAPVVDLVLGKDHCQVCVENDEPRDKELFRR